MEQVDTTMLARNLRRARKAAGLTQVQLSEKAQKSPNTVSTLESGKVLRPHLGTILDLADALNVAPEDLIGDAATPKGEGAQLENGQRRAYPYPWMGEAFGDLLLTWKKAVEQGYSPGYCRAITSGAYDAMDTVVPPLTAAFEALPAGERRERQLLGRELLQLAHDAYAVFEEGSADPDVLESAEVHRIEARREEMVRRTRQIAS